MKAIIKMIGYEGEEVLTVELKNSTRGDGTICEYLYNGKINGDGDLVHYNTETDRLELLHFVSLDPYGENRRCSYLAFDKSEYEIIKD